VEERVSAKQEVHAVEDKLDCKCIQKYGTGKTEKSWPLGLRSVQCYVSGSGSK
jgi:hypothetical protein